jgi:hypothetical protein
MLEIDSRKVRGSGRLTLPIHAPKLALASADLAYRFIVGLLEPGNLTT